MVRNYLICRILGHCEDVIDMGDMGDMCRKCRTIIGGWFQYVVTFGPLQRK